jgi:hypothetical protein
MSGKPDIGWRSQDEDELSSLAVGITLLRLMHGKRNINGKLIAE